MLFSWKKQQPGKKLQPEGEVVFGVHPVMLALTSHHRQHIHRLYVDGRHRQAKPSHPLAHIQDLATQRNVPVEFVSKNTLMYLAGNRPHQVRLQFMLNCGFGI